VASYTLIRAAIEISAAAVWILEPSEHEERVRRALRISAQNINDYIHAARGRGDALSPDVERQSAEIDTRLRQLKFEKGQWLKSTEVVREVSRCARGDGSILAAWRVYSAFAHGRLWSVTEQDLVPISIDKDNDTVVYWVTADLGRVVAQAMAAMDTIDHAIRLYRRRAA